MSSDLVLMSVVEEPRTQWFLEEFSRQRHTRKWLSFGWLERRDNVGLMAPLSVYSNEDLRGYY